MLKNLLVVLVTAVIPACVSAQDGVVLIGQGTLGRFPYVISQPGSYKLSSNLTNIPANTDAIQIVTDDVTLDLNGFSIIGPGAGQGTGINTWPPTITFPAAHITILNGTVRSMYEGILCAYDCIVQGIHARKNILNGIRVFGFSLVTGNVADFNGTYGIVAGQQGNTLKHNVVSNNGIGLGADCPSSLLGNTAFQNKQDISTFDNSGAPSNNCNRSQNLPAP